MGVLDMKLAFIYYSERAYEDSEGNIYTGGNFPQEVWDRYLSITDELYVVMRKGKRINPYDNNKQSLELVNDSRIHMILLDDIYLSISNFLNGRMKNHNKIIIQDTLKKCDAIIIREAHSPIMPYVRQSEKPYLIEVIGDPFSICWNHGLKGKIMAFPEWYKARREIKRAKWVIYVTEEYLQKLYPTRGRSAAISDVAIPDVKEDVIKERMRKIEENDGHIIIGTAAALDVKYKGHRFIIKALAELARKGFDFEYQVVGAGRGEKIRNLSKDLGIENRVKIIGRLTHKETLAWMRNIDIYINPSLTEGLPRAVVEAASLGVPCYATNIGGHPEILVEDYLYNPKTKNGLRVLLEQVNKEVLKENSKRNFNKAKKFQRIILDGKRKEFLDAFVNTEALS